MWLLNKYNAWNGEKKWIKHSTMKKNHGTEDRAKV